MLTAWKKAVADGKPIKITDPEMTRFWLSPNQAVDHIEYTLSRDIAWSGWIYIPRIPALSIGKLAEYTVGDVEIERIAVRPGEKLHETLLTLEETFYVSSAMNDEGGRILNPTISPFGRHTCCKQDPITSDTAHQLTKEELMALLNE